MLKFFMASAFALFSTLAFAQSLPSPNFGGLKINGAVESFPASGNIVGTTDTQTLSSKTLSSPAISSPTITGPIFSGLSGPIIGNGASPATAGTLSGNTTKLGTVSGALTSGHCVVPDGSGNLIDGGTPTTCLNNQLPSQTGNTGKVLGTNGSSVSWVAPASGLQVSIKDYGAVCNGSTDDTTAIQNAWNAAQTALLNVNLSGVGSICKISSLTAPTPVQRSLGVLPPVASMLIGNGMNTVELLSTVTGTSCAITLTETYESFQPTGTMGGFALRQSSDTQPSAGGYGICLINVTQLNVDGVFIRGFARGLDGTDTINLNINHSIFYHNDWHIHGAMASNSNPNAWTIENSRFGVSNQYGIFLVHPDQINILNNTFEANGVNTGLQPATVYADGNAVDGSFGLNIQGNYFEDDGGNSIVLQSISGGESHPVSHNIIGNTFVRNAAATTNILINNLDSSHGLSVNVQSNGFLDTATLGGGIYRGGKCGHP
jgi:hypothetical protein